MDADLLRRWWADHGEIDRAVDEVRLELGRSESGGEHVARLAAALERHFATEEEIYFPLVARKSPQSAHVLERARQGHQQLRMTLEQLRVLVENADVAAAHRTLATLLKCLAAHEEEEVAILSSSSGG